MPHSPSSKSETFVPRLLVVNDSQLQAKAIADECKAFLDNANINIALSGREALQSLNQEDTTPHLMFLDINMPEINGVEVLSIIKSTRPQIRIYMMTTLSENSPECVEAYEKGPPDGYIPLPLEKESVGFRARVKSILRSISEKYESSQEIAHKMQENEQAKLAALHAILKVLSSRDVETAEHLEELEHYSNFILRRWFEQKQIGITPQNAEYIARFSKAIIFHDIGKAGIEDQLLLTKEKYTPEQRLRMMEHVQIGLDTLDKIEPNPTPGSTLELVRRFIAEHQEWYDGTGYPMKKKGNDISFEGRMGKLLDATHALLSDRPYKPAFSIQRLTKHLQDQSGKEFDPELVEFFLKNVEGIGAEIKRIKLTQNHRPPQTSNVTPIAAAAASK